MDRTDSLADLGNWPAINIDHRSHTTIRHAYDQVISFAARLACFATGSPTKTSGPIDDRQETLAVDDLVHFAIHARRLIENTAKRRRFSHVALRSRSTLGPIELKIATIINMLIHHEDIEIIRTELKLELVAGASREIAYFLNLPNRSFQPLIIVKSDRERTVIFDLQELIETFQQKVLQPIIELCDEHELFLEEI